MDVVVAENITKVFAPRRNWFGKKQGTTLRAASEVSFSIPDGCIFSLLGPNGAGKSTIIKILATLLLPDTGRASICGHDVQNESMQVRRLLGTVLPGERTLFWRLTVRENLAYFSDLLGLARSYSRARINELLAAFELENKRDILVEKLSTGQRQRVVLCRALLAAPPVLLLDEPTLGLDPSAARSLRSLVKKLRDNGHSILLTTHYMYEADELSDTVAIINDGKIQTIGTPMQLKNTLRDRRMVTLRAQSFSPEFVAMIRNKFAASDPRITSSEANNYNSMPHEEMNFAVNTTFSVEHLLAAANGDIPQPLSGLQVSEPSLEDVFLTYTGRSLKDPESVVNGS